MSSSNYVYLDYAASAPLSQAAREAEAAYEAFDFAAANPNSLHSQGRKAAQILEQSRKTIATALSKQFRPNNLIFTSGGTESNNLALIGIAEGQRARDKKRRIVVMSEIEHDSILDVQKLLETHQFEVKKIGSTELGELNLDFLESYLAEHALEVALVSVMAANNESGIIQPLEQIADMCHKHQVIFHTDAAQAFCKCDLDFGKADAVSIAGHKIGAPVGIGALALKASVPFMPQSLGGGQEQGRRPGTQAVRAAYAFAAAVKDKLAHPERLTSCHAKTAQVYETICASPFFSPSVSLDANVKRLPGIVNVLCSTKESEALILHLDAAGFGVSAGSACSSGSPASSHVLKAMHVSDKLARGALRISFDDRVDTSDLQRFCETLVKIAGV